MRILLFGNNGQLGWELERSLQCLGQVLALDYPEVDFLRPNSLPQIVSGFKPQVVINAAAYTDVDKAEVEQDRALTINSEAPARLAAICRDLDAAFIHFSTDYVFDGRKGSPYTEGDSPNPLNFYGLTKLEGERAVLNSGATSLILRTAWLYSLRRESFVTKVLQWARTKPEIRIVDDQISNPTWARSLAEITAAMLAKASISPIQWLCTRTGVYHIAGGGYTSRFEWARLILSNDPHKSEHSALSIYPASSEDFPTAATRPLFSALNCERFESVFTLNMLEWEKAIRLALAV